MSETSHQSDITSLDIFVKTSRKRYSNISGISLNKQDLSQIHWTAKMHKSQYHSSFKATSKYLATTKSQV